jgi:hypothetical protein
MVNQRIAEEPQKKKVASPGAIAIALKTQSV